MNKSIQFFLNLIDGMNQSNGKNELFVNEARQDGRRPASRKETNSFFNPQSIKLLLHLSSFIS